MDTLWKVWTDLLDVIGIDGILLTLDCTLQYGAKNVIKKYILNTDRNCLVAKYSAAEVNLCSNGQTQ